MSRARREALKYSLVSTWGRVRALRTRPTPRAIVLCYHSIHPDRSFASASPRSFDEQLAWLTDNFQVLPLSPESLHRAKALSLADAPIVMLTFDDGYDDNYEYAFPALVKHGVYATFFVTTGLLTSDNGTVSRFQRERDCPVEDLHAMGWGQMREMRDAGMLFGSHTHTHRNLATLDSLQASEELRISKDVLEDGLGEPVTMLAYPYGKPRVHFTYDGTVPLVRQHNYNVAAAVLAREIRKSDSDLVVPRFFATRDDVANLDAKIRGTWDIVGWWQERAPLRLQRLVSPADFSH